jgi:hypothetical protein
MTDETTQENGSDLVKIPVGDEIVEIDLMKESAIGPDLDKEMDEVSSQIAWFGELLGAIKRDAKILDKSYRKWRAQMSVELLKKDKSMAEWKVKAHIESNPQFEKFKTAEAQCNYNDTTITELIAALKEKSQNVRSKGARLRSEMESTGMTTRMSQQRELSKTQREQMKENP